VRGNSIGSRVQGSGFRVQALGSYLYDDPGTRGGGILQGTSQVFFFLVK
jgi:hypothetical protein